MDFSLLDRVVGPDVFFMVKRLHNIGRG